MNRIKKAFFDLKNVTIYTSKGAERINFPRKESKILIQDLKGIISIIDVLCDGKLEVANELCEAIIDSLKNSELKAFSNMLNSLEWILWTVVNQNKTLVQLMEENVELKMKVQKLESDISVEIGDSNSLNSSYEKSGKSFKSEENTIEVDELESKCLNLKRMNKKLIFQGI